MANDPFSGLAEGLKWGLERGDKARESQAERAFRLKMQNAMIEQNIALKTQDHNQKLAENDATRWSPEITKGFAEQAGVTTQPGYKALPTEGSALSGMSRTKVTRSARDQRYEDQKNLASLNDDALIEAILNNPEQYDKVTKSATLERIIPKLQAKGFVYNGKPLSGEAQRMVLNATSGLGAIDRINARASASPEEFKRLYAPGSIGAKDLLTDLKEAKDVVTRIRTGAAESGNERMQYEAQMLQNTFSNFLDDLADGELDNKALFYSLNQVYRPFLRAASNLKETNKIGKVVRPEDEKAKEAKKQQNLIDAISNAVKTRKL